MKQPEDDTEVILTREDRLHLKELVEDRKAVNRVFSKFKMFFFGIAAAVAAWWTIVEKGLHGLIK